MNKFVALSGLAFGLLALSACDQAADTQKATAVSAPPPFESVPEPVTSASAIFSFNGINDLNPSGDVELTEEGDAVRAIIPFRKNIVVVNPDFVVEAGTTLVTELAFEVEQPIQFNLYLESFCMPREDRVNSYKRIQAAGGPQTVEFAMTFEESAPCARAYIKARAGDDLNIRIKDWTIVEG